MHGLFFAAAGCKPTEACVSCQNKKRLGWAARSWLQHEIDKVPCAANWDGTGEGLSADEGGHTELASWILVKTQPKFFQGEFYVNSFCTSNTFPYSYYAMFSLILKKEHLVSK